ncbi:MAG TPA: SMP-30/gluconolactonase/LRE family protein [Woeseiaceae bacterium]|nr:SMP-30/gluconolactonase/LRE family protein [Woeseiaceae bacterium]
MLRSTLAALGVLLAVLALYLLLWPVPVDPVAWQAPVDRGYVDPFSPNDSLTAATNISLGEFEAPEDATFGSDQRIYVTTRNGMIVRVQNRGISEYADVGGRPLGIEADRDGSLLVANSYLGIQRVTADREVVTLLDEIDGKPLNYANNLAVGQDGTIYFSVSSSKFGAEEYRGTYEAALLDILEHGGHGSVYAFNPGTGDVTCLLDGLNYANGVAISDDDSFILVSETGHYRIIKYWLAGENRGRHEVLIENLPGFPDNIKSGANGRFWIGFAAPRNRLIDQWSDKPLLRKMIQRLPASMRPRAEPLSHVIAINGGGDVLMNMHDPEARFPTLTGVLETRDNLYLTTLFGNQLPRIAKRDL